MIIDASSGEVGDLVGGNDVVVVGAGTVGLLIAKLLADKKLSVAVIETGDRVATTLDDGFGATSIGRYHSGVDQGRGFGLGGTSALWGGQLAEFVECDLVRPGCEWPLSYPELRQWYDRAYEALGLPGRATDDDYRRAFGIVASSHHAIEQFFTSWLPQPNLAYLFKKALLESKHIRVYLGATANSMECTGPLARSLTATTRSGRALEFAARDFVLAAGTVANAQFFLSTARRSNVPWGSNSLLGAYFQDHLGIKAFELDVVDVVRFRTMFENGFALGRKLQPKLRFTPRERVDAPIGVCGAFAFRSSISEQLGQLKGLVRGMRSGLAHSSLMKLPAHALKLGGALAPLVVRYVKDRRVMAMFDQGVDLLLQAEQRPVRESRIGLLDNEPGPNGLMRVGVDWRIDGCEVDVIRRFASEARDFLESQGLARMRPSTGLPAEDAGIADRIADTFHQCGGMRMSSSAELGVTDPNCRVWRTDNVFVAGAAVLPSSSYANSTLTALALSVRLSEHLAARSKAIH